MPGVLSADKSSDLEAGGAREGGAGTALGTVVNGRDGVMVVRNPPLYLRNVLRAIATTPASEVHRLTSLSWKRAHGSGLSVAAVTPVAMATVS